MQFKTLVEALEYWAQETPDKTCLIDADTDQSLTYGQLWHFSRVFARRLQKLGFEKDGRVVVRVGGVLQTMVAQFGTYVAGGVYCPLEPHIKELKLQEMMQYFDASILVSTQKINYECECINLESLLCDGEEIEKYTLPHPQDMCAIIFTTGTTGKAKGVMISYKMAEYSANELIKILSVTNTDGECFLCTSLLYKIAGVRTFGVAFIKGICAIYLIGAYFAKDFFATIEKYNVTTAQLLPQEIIFQVKNAKKKYTEVRHKLKSITAGGMRLPVDVVDSLIELLPHTDIMWTYGATENSPVAFCELKQITKNLQRVGKPCSNTKISFVDDAGVPVNATAENPGIIVLKNLDATTKGYWKSEEETAKALKDGRLITADIGYIDDEGFLCLLGRKDDVIVSGGHKIAPYEIEDVAMLHPDVKECACVGKKHDLLGQAPWLYVVMNEGAAFDEPQIRKFLQNRIEKYKLPNAIKCIQSIPKTAEYGKIDRKALRNYD